MDLYAVLADIHANEEALGAVDADARNEAAKLGASLHFICLGDVVDYGPSPATCVRWVRDTGATTIQGNHDDEVAAPLDRPILSVASDYQPITLWTKLTLEEDERRWLGQLPATLTAIARRGEAPGDLFTLFHSSLSAPNARLDNAERAERDMELLRTPYGLFGHTHHQGLFRRGVGRIVTGLVCRPDTPLPPDWQAYLPNIWHDMPYLSSQALFNPGSVGQPRTHAWLAAQNQTDHRAAYMLICPEQGFRGRFQFRRVEYDVDRTIQRLTEELHWPTLLAPPAEAADSAATSALLAHSAEHLPALVRVLARTLRPVGLDANDHAAQRS